MRMSSHPSFVGREAQFDLLHAHLSGVRAGGRDQLGRALLLRGRRRVGKSRLVEVFVDRAGVPSAFWTAQKGAPPIASMRALLQAVIEESSLPNRAALDGVTPTDWRSTLRLLADVLPDDQPSIVVLDEVPWLIEADGSFESALQAEWDRRLSKKPVLLILVGSDLSMMEALSTYDRPFYQRGVEMVLDALTPAEVADMCGLRAAGAIDAYLITGGLPVACQQWPRGALPEVALRRAFSDPTSPLIVSGERILAAEFPAELRARRVLEAVGADGERSFTNIARAAGAGAGPLNQTTLSNSLDMLRTKRLVAVDEPLATKANTTARRYRIADPYLRFWLAFVERSLPAIERGRGDLAVARWQREWESWRGRAVEPVIRASLERLMPDDRFTDVNVVGGWWPRTNTPEIDLVGADRSPARLVSFVGSIKWRERTKFTGRDAAELASDAVSVPGVDTSTAMVGVSRSGFNVEGLAAMWTPDDLVDAWRR